MNFKPSFFWLLDNAHGGFIDGVYQSPEKQSPVLSDGNTLYEGEFTRNIAQRIALLCQDNGLSCRLLVPTEEDLPNRHRVHLANEIHNEMPRCVLLSIRLNKDLAGNENQFSSAHGISAYYYQKENKFWPWGWNDEKDQRVKNLAKVFLYFLKRHTGLSKRGIKNSKHPLLMNLNMPAVITRSGFIDNKQEAKMLLTEDFRQKIAQAHFESMLYMEQNGLDQSFPSDFEMLPKTAPASADFNQS